MKDYIPVLKKNKLFKQTEDNNLLAMLNCLGASVKSFKKNEIVYLSGEKIEWVGFVLSGRIKIVKNDFYGNQVILAGLGAGEIFGETLACAGMDNSPVTVIANEDVKLMFLKFSRLITTCNSACQFHTKIIENMLQLMARKNLFLNRRIDLLSQRTISEKLKLFFMKEMEKNQSESFEIDFSRSELADFLCVDRSALSRELCKMRDSGKLEFERNRFKIIDLE